MNLLLLAPEDFIDEHIAYVDGRRFQHLKKIIKVTTGSPLAAGIINGKIGTATVQEIHSNHLLVNTSFTRLPPSPASCTLILALPRPLMLKRVLQSITSIGIKELHFIHAKKVENSYWNSSDLEEETVRQQLFLGLEQAMDTTVPNIYFHKNFKTFFSKHLSILAKNKQALLAQPGSTTPCPANVRHASLLAIGPEGGFTTEENQAFIQCGFEPVNIGNRILRVETAVSVLLGKILPL